MLLIDLEQHQLDWPTKSSRWPSTLWVFGDDANRATTKFTEKNNLYLEIKNEEESERCCRQRRVWLPLFWTWSSIYKTNNGAKENLSSRDMMLKIEAFEPTWLWKSHKVVQVQLVWPNLVTIKKVTPLEQKLSCPYEHNISKARAPSFIPYTRDALWSTLGQRAHLHAGIYVLA